MKKEAPGLGAVIKPYPSCMSAADSDPRLLDRLRAWRAPSAPDRSIESDITRLVRQIETRTKAVGGFDELWATSLPQRLAAKSRVIRWTKAGDLHIGADDAPTRYAIDAWLRSGGLEKLRGASSRGIRAINLK